MASHMPPEIESAVLRLIDTLRGEAIKYVTAQKLPDIKIESLVLEQVTDPANGLHGYEGIWRNAMNERVGKLIINSDGSYFAEYDLCIRHPNKPAFFIEAVTAWGRGEQMKAEPRLLAML